MEDYYGMVYPFPYVMETDALAVTNTRLLEIIWWNSGIGLASIMFFSV